MLLMPESYLGARPNVFNVLASTAVQDAEVRPPSSVDYQQWLPFAAKTYKISPRIEDYVLVTIPICPSDIPNRNGIGFPISELVAYQPPPINRQVFKAWAGCPVHIEHQNEDHEAAIGVIFDSDLTKITSYGQGKLWKVMGLIGIDKNKAPQIAQQVLETGSMNGSMGAMADFFTCSVCGAQAYKESYKNCSHITSTQDVNWRIVDYGGQKRLAFLNARSLSPIEFSWVKDPAWVPSTSDIILSRGQS